MTTATRATTTDEDFQRVATEFSFKPQATYESFKAVGFGPFVVQWTGLVEKVLNVASPHVSVHINGCRGAGKTTLLNLIGLALQAKNETVYFIENATFLNRELVIHFVKTLANEKKQVWLLIDETQDNVGGGLYTLLLKNTMNHKITTVGAGVPEYQTMSQKFTQKVDTSDLFLSSNEVMVREGVVDYFSGVAAAVGGPAAANVESLRTVLEHVRNYVGGHIHPLMWLSEVLVTKRVAQGYNTAQTLEYLHSYELQGQDQYKAMADRCLPDILSTDVRPLLYKTQDPTLLYDLKRKGFCDANNKILSEFLFEEFISKISSSHSFKNQLSHGVEGVQELLQFALPNLDWTPYNPFGGPIEDALTLELLIILSGVSYLKTRLFNPKLVNVGTAARKPDLYFNSRVDSFVECVLTSAINNTEIAKLDEHILRFFPKTPGGTPHYVIGNSSFAILNYQKMGDRPIKPSPQYQGRFFESQVFTFLMSTKEVYRGSTRIAGP